MKLLCFIFGHRFRTFLFDDVQADKSSIMGMCTRCSHTVKFFDIKETPKVENAKES